MKMHLHNFCKLHVFKAVEFLNKISNDDPDVPIFS